MDQLRFVLKVMIDQPLRNSRFAGDIASGKTGQPLRLQEMFGGTNDILPVFVHFFMFPFSEICFDIIVNPATKLMTERMLSIINQTINNCQAIFAIRQKMS